MRSGGSIGIDLDNTLASYEVSLGHIADSLGVSSEGHSKRALRDAIRVQGGDELWQLVQAQIYGPRMHEAVLARGALDFIRMCRQQNIRIWIISHKTEFSPVDPQRTPLRAKALEWLETQGVLTTGVAAADVFFESTRAAKLERIGICEPDIFIDDLAEVLDDPGFPPAVKKIHFCPDMSSRADATPFAHFDDIRRHIFGH